ncbi:MAG: N-acetyl-gamma-glutamyl-phosphate reductase [Deltaproteobacteria bacterium]|nr:N-acetyl-gamma-glutamyl-phosphate reductase [Deltaproteobacteria bacterium]
MTQVAVIGAAGLSGLELIRMLTRHPGVALTTVTSGKYAGQPVADVFPELEGCSLTFQRHDAPLSGCQVVFLAVPNQASLEAAPRLMEQGLRVIDLSGVFRLRDPEVFKAFYKLPHPPPALMAQAVFGLPEAFRAQLAQARLVANPGCYPTGALLGLLPLGELARDLASPPIIDAKSGVSGAGGRVEDDSTSFHTVYENFKAYKVFSHQHLPEIAQYFSDLTPYQAGKQGDVIFTPHLLPVFRGILSTIYLRFQRAVSKEELRARYQAFAQKEPFVRLLPEGDGAELRMAQHTNRCVISLHGDPTGKNWVVLTAIDNLLKGASGQAVQNMNLMLGLEETAGLL